MTRKSGILLLAAFVLLGHGLAACGGGNNCAPACETAIACDQWGNVGTLNDCLDWCEGVDRMSCSEGCNGIADCTQWAICMEDLCSDVW